MNEDHIRGIPPFSFNVLKHHLAFIRDLAADRLVGVIMLKTMIKRIGQSQIDVYEGLLSPVSIQDLLNQMLKSEGVHDRHHFKEWIGKKSYKLVSVTDQSVWVLRESNDPVRYIHLHPARNSPQTFRVRGHTLKTVILVKGRITGPVQQLKIVNQVRTELGLPPLQRITANSGCGLLFRKLSEL